MGRRGRIFISYRRDDAPGDARNLYKELASTFGKPNVFMDVDKLLAGQRFDRELDKALSQCNALLAVIGPRWMELLSDRAGSGERDFVHDEIAAALKRDIVVIPVLIGREERMPSLPRRDDLPDDIRALVLHQKKSIAHESFDRDAAELIVEIKTVLRGESRVVPWRAVGISSGIGFLMIAALLAYGTGTFWPSPSNPPPSQGMDGGTRIAQDRAAAEAAAEASKRAAADAAAKNAAAESARKKAAEEEVNRKAAEETRRQAEADAAKKKAEEDGRKVAEEAARNKAVAEEAARQAEADAARKKAEEEAANKKAAAECDRLAAAPFDTTRPSGVPGIDFAKLDPVAATGACSDAMRRYPEVVRFVFQAGRAADVRQDYARALELYRKASAGGNAAAMNGLGDLYFNGQGVTRDYSEARTWYEKGVTLGNAEAMTNLGLLYDKGDGVAQDHVKACALYEKAAALGERVAMLNLGLSYNQGEGVAQDHAKAREWYEKGAALGQPGAMSNLGVLYENGEGVAQDYAKARGWYEKAAALGSHIAMFNLGMLYEKGQGADKNLRQARRWYQKAADAGNERAKASLKKLK